MWRATVRNRAFDRMGDRFGHLIDPNHFGGRNAFDIKKKKEEAQNEERVSKQAKEKVQQVRQTHEPARQ